MKNEIVFESSKELDFKEYLTVEFSDEYIEGFDLINKYEVLNILNNDYQQFSYCINFNLDYINKIDLYFNIHISFYNNCKTILEEF